MCFLNQILRVTGRVCISADSMDKGMSLIIQNPEAGLDRILKFVKRVWIKVDSRQTHPIDWSSWCKPNFHHVGGGVFYYLCECE